MPSRLPLVLALASIAGAGIVTVAVTAEADQNQDQTTAVQPSQQRFIPSQADRAAFLDAKIAALHAGLELTADQEKLWPPVDTALRNTSAVITQQRETAKNTPRPTDPVAWLERMSNNTIARGDALKKLADAAGPLYATFTDAQKHRLPILLRATHLRLWRPHFAMNEGWHHHDGGWQGHEDNHASSGDHDEDGDHNDRGDRGDWDQH